MTWNLYNSRKEGWKISLAERLKYYRNKSGLSQATVAKELKVSRQAISKWENGRGYPDIDNLILLSNTYKVSIDQLLKEIEEVQEEITNNKVEYTQKRQFLIMNKKKTEVEIKWWRSYIIDYCNQHCFVVPIRSSHYSVYSHSQQKNE